MSGNHISYYQCLYKKNPFKPGRLFYCLLLSISLQSGMAQTTATAGIDEVEVELTFAEIGNTQLTALIIDQKAWLSVPQLFEFLKINHKSSVNGDSLYGYLLNPESRYLLDAKNKQLVLNETRRQLPAQGLIVYRYTQFLQANLFFDLFKLDCRFDFRSLSVRLTTAWELPVVREKKQDLMRNNLNKLRNVFKADTSIDLEYATFRQGMADWSVNTTNDFKGLSDIRANVTMGGIIAGGEAIAALQYNNKTIFASSQQYFLWRHVSNYNPLLKQVSLGRIITNATSSIYAPVIGVQFSNSPTTLRRSFGSYRLNRYTEPNWIVELYVNSVLVDYTRSDASGFYSFDIPIVYGNTHVQIRYYGPNGEQRTGEADISMPFTFLPTGQVEYTVSGAVVEDSAWSKFSRSQINYGLFRRLTIGSGVEYLSSIADRKTMPFFIANFRLTRNMLFSAEYTAGVRTNIAGNYRLPSNVQFEINYTRYVKGQKAIYNTYLEERRAAVSFPLRLKGFNSYSRLSFYQILLPGSKYTTAEAMIAGMLFGVSANFSTYALFADNYAPYLYSNLSMGIWLPGKLMIMPQIQYEYNNLRFISVKGEVEKRISTKAYINGYYESNFKSNFRSVNIGFRYDLTFAHIGVALRKSTGSEPAALITSVRGGIVHDNQTGYTAYTADPGVGRGGLILVSFLDLNNNGKRDPGEPKVSGLRFTIAGGFREENKQDTSIVIRNLEAYSNYLISIDRNSFNEIAWQIIKGSISVEITPNQFRILEIPVNVLNEVSGTVYLQTGKIRKVQERILINIYNSNGVRVAQTLSDADGYYSYMGLTVGAYTASPDLAQMLKLQLQFAPHAWHFEMEAGFHGDEQKGIDFILTPLPPPANTNQ